MEQIEIREVPIRASRIGLGTWAMGGVQWGGTDDDDIDAVVANSVRDPVGPEFMAPPEGKPDEQHAGAA